MGFHLISFIPITLIGAWYFARAGLTFAELSAAGSVPPPNDRAAATPPAA